MDMDFANLSDNPARMSEDSVTVRRLKRDSPEFLQCARWRYDEFLSVYGYSFDESLRQFVQVVSDPDHDAAFIARRKDVAIGLCMLVREELDARHAFSPWLASMFVVPESRRCGVGRTLVRAVEDHARSLCARHLYLYTARAEIFYKRCGWRTVERFDWDGEPFVLMIRDLWR